MFDIEFHKDAEISRGSPLYGEQFLIRYPNGYGASIIHSRYSYGVELAVIAWEDEEDFQIVYDTPLTDDVIGYETPESLLEHLEAIRILPPYRPQIEETP